MNTVEKNNYVQYVNRNGIVKAKNVVFEDDGTTTRFTVDGIDEEFFIFAIYQNNIQRFCVGIDNLENTDMLGFINANVVDLSSIPSYAFLQSQTVVQFSYNNDYVQNYRFGSNTSFNSITSEQHWNNISSFQAYDSFGNQVLDPNGMNVFNVKILQSYQDDLLQNNEARFLYNFCKSAYPDANFTIKAFVHNLTEIHPIINPNFNKLYCINPSFIANKNFVCELLKKGVSDDETSYVNQYFIPNQFALVLANRVTPSTGSNFAGITGVTPVNSFIQLSGYVAIFENNFFAGG